MGRRRAITMTIKIYLLSEYLIDNNKFRTQNKDRKEEAEGEDRKEEEVEVGIRRARRRVIFPATFSVPFE